MKIALTGTPGTGKSTISRLVDGRFRVVDINGLITEKFNTGADPQRGSLVADLDGLAAYVEGLSGDMVLDGHLSHLLPVDKIIVLRASPATLKLRLWERGWSEDKITENLEAEALDVILIEALEQPAEVYEIDTTGLIPEQVAAAVREIVGGTAKYRPGSVDFSEEMFL